MYFVFGIGFFVLAWVIFRQNKELKVLRADNAELQTKLCFAKRNINYAMEKYTEMLDFASEQVDRADQNEEKHKNAVRSIYIHRRRAHLLRQTRKA